MLSTSKSITRPPAHVNNLSTIPKKILRMDARDRREERLIRTAAMSGSDRKLVILAEDDATRALLTPCDWHRTGRGNLSLVQFAEREIDRFPSGTLPSSGTGWFHIDLFDPTGSSKIKQLCVITDGRQHDPHDGIPLADVLPWSEKALAAIAKAFRRSRTETICQRFQSLDMRSKEAKKVLSFARAPRSASSRWRAVA